MKPAACPRAFEVEAMRDGRLTGAALASFARHVDACGACFREAKALEGLAERLRATPPQREGQGDDLHTLRERVRLLAAFDRSLVGPSPAGRRAPRRMLWSASVVAVATCAVVLWRGHGPVAGARSAGTVVRAEAAAVWSRRDSADREEITLVRGTLSIRVDHASRRGRVVVLLPDGELEDTGTVFTVSAADGRTVGVSVDEGSVVLRLRGRPPVSVTAGNVWSSAPQAPPIGDGEAAAPLPPPVSLSPPPSSVDPASVARPARAATPSARRSSLSIAAASDPSAEFRAALAALDAGSNLDAAAAFARFGAAHPRDARAEDAAYLRVLALQRSGADADMRSAANEYLRLYPAGFRRAEVAKLSRAARVDAVTPTR